MVKIPFDGVEIEALVHRFDAVLAKDVKVIPDRLSNPSDDNFDETLNLALGLLQRLGRLGGGNFVGQGHPDP